MKLLLFNLPEGKTQAMRLLLAGRGVDIRTVEAADFCQPIGFLAGLPGFPAVKPFAAAFGEEMMVLCGFDQQQLADTLDGLRQAGVPPVPLKAVLTQHNAGWSALALRGELLRERDEIARSLRK